MNIFEFINVPAAIVPDRAALQFEGRRLDFEGLRGNIVNLARCMEHHGIDRQSTVAILDSNSDRYIMVLYAAAFLGSTLYPLNNRAKGAELTHLLDAAKPTILFVGEGYVEQIEAALADLGLTPLLVSLGSAVSSAVAWQNFLEAGAANEDSSDDEYATEDIDDENAVAIFTAGTTAHPKVVPLRHSALTTYVMESSDPPDEDDDHYAQLLVAPLYHIAGLTSAMLSPYSGRRLVVHGQFESGAWLQSVETEQITHAFVVPTMLKRIIDDPHFHQHDLTSLEFLTYGAAPMPQSTLLRALQVFPSTVGFVNSYGQTETTATVTMLGVDDHRLSGTPEQIEAKKRRLLSIGKALDDVEIRIVDESRRPVAIGVIGELAIRTGRAMTGYLGANTAIDHSRHDDDRWLYTADLAWIDEEDYVFLAGRQSELIIRAGENISPAEVEAVLFQHPDVDDVAVLGAPDDDFGERVIAYVVRRPKAVVTGEELIEFCRTRMASFKKPAEIHFVDDLPRSSVGKVLKRSLKETYLNMKGYRDSEI